MKFLCPLPWLSISTESQREIRLCCHESRENLSNSYLEEFSSTLEVFNLPLLKDTRMTMLKGEIPTACRGCSLLEKETEHSPRLEYLDRFKLDFPELLSATKEDGELSKAKLVYLDVTTDNHCNLKCRMCRPRYSEKISSDWETLGWNPGERETKGIDINLSVETYKSSGVLEENFKHLRMITLTGGEPFLSSAVEALLDRVINSGHAKKISLRFFSNTTIYPKNLKLYLDNFEKIQIYCSLDGYGKTSDYIRYPSKWGTIDRVYKELLSTMRERDNLRVDLHTVVQALNITQINDLFEYLSEFNGFVPLLPSFTHVDSTLPLSVSYLPMDLLNKVEENFEKFLKSHEKALKNHHQEFHQREIKNFQNLIKRAKENNNPAKFIDVVIYAKKLDKLRGQSIQENFPEFKLGQTS